MSSHPVAIVTGSSRGIGRAIAVELARTGHDVVVNYANNQAAADEVVAEIHALGRDALAVGANVAMAEDRARLVAAAMDRWHRLDVLVNNAGITSPGRRDLLEATEESWDQVFATNLKGPFFLAQLAAKQMIESRRARRETGVLAARSVSEGHSPPAVSLADASGYQRQDAAFADPKGTIINVSSISAYAVSTNRADYCMAKAAMQMMTWLLATRLADEGILAYEVCPGVIASDMTAPVKEKYDKLIDEGMSPIRRWGQPDDVARAVAMLASGTLPFSTGERINVDGGFHIRRL